jgi:hypothetical protein
MKAGDEIAISTSPARRTASFRNAPGSAGATTDDRGSGYGAPVVGLRIRTPPSARGLLKSNMLSMGPAIVSNEAPG